MRSPIHQLKEFVRTSRDLKNLGNILKEDPSHGEVVRLRMENRSAILGLLAYLGVTIAGGGIGFGASKIHLETHHAATKPVQTAPAETLECLQPGNPSLTHEEFAEAVTSRLEAEINYGSLTPEGKTYAMRLLFFLRNYAWINGHPLQRRVQLRHGDVQSSRDFRLTALQNAPDGWFKKHRVSMFDKGTQTLYLIPPIPENPKEVDPDDKTGNSYSIQNDMRTADCLIAVHDAAYYKGEITGQSSPFTDPDLCKLIPANLMNTLRIHSRAITPTFKLDNPRSIHFNDFLSALREFGNSFSQSVLSTNVPSGHLNGVSEAAIYIYVRCLLASGERPEMNNYLSEIALNPVIIHNVIEGKN